MEIRTEQDAADYLDSLDRMLATGQIGRGERDVERARVLRALERGMFDSGRHARRRGWWLGALIFAVLAVALEAAVRTPGLAAATVALIVLAIVSAIRALTLR